MKSIWDDISTGFANLSELYTATRRTLKSVPEPYFIETKEQETKRNDYWTCSVWGLLLVEEISQACLKLYQFGLVFSMTFGITCVREGCQDLLPGFHQVKTIVFTRFVQYLQKTAHQKPTEQTRNTLSNPIWSCKINVISTRCSIPDICRRPLGTKLDTELILEVKCRILHPENKG